MHWSHSRFYYALFVIFLLSATAAVAQGFPDVGASPEIARAMRANGIVGEIVIGAEGSAVDGTQGAPNRTRKQGRFIRSLGAGFFSPAQARRLGSARVGAGLTSEPADRELGEIDYSEPGTTLGSVLRGEGIVGKSPGPNLSVPSPTEAGADPAAAGPSREAQGSGR